MEELKRQIIDKSFNFEQDNGDFKKSTIFLSDLFKILESKQLNLGGVIVPKGTLFCEKVIHHTCKHFDTYNGCMGCLVKNYEAK